MREKEFKQWMRRQRNTYSASTINKTVKYVKYIESKLELNFDMVSIEDISDRLYDFLEGGMSVDTLNTWIKIINRYLVFLGYENKLKRFKQTENEDDEYFYVPSDEEKDAILKVTWTHLETNSRNRAFLYLLFSTGLRIGEAIMLNWGDIDISDPSTPLIFVRHGKGEKKRHVPLPPNVLKIILDYKEKYRLKTDPNAVFTTPQGRLSHGYARKICKDAGKRAGIPQFHAHAARHWRAITWLKEGVNLETIRRFLGHKYLKTTQRYIRRLQVEWSMDEIKKKDMVFGSWKPIGSEYLKKLRGEV